jgi:hypothetical protein
MPQPICLIISRQNDSHTDVVSQKLRSRGVEFAICDSAAPLAGRPMTIGSESEILHLPTEPVGAKLGSVRTVWLRRPQPTEGVAPVVNAERELLLRGIWMALADRQWINPLAADRAAHHKPYQLAVARAVGLSVPRTLVTNDPGSVVPFADECNGRIVYKTCEPARRRINDQISAVYTSAVPYDHLKQLSSRVTLGPCIFQEHLDIESELRVTVFGPHIFTAEIVAGDRPQPDWRRDVGAARITSARLEDVVERQVRDMLVRLNLVVGCIDLAKCKSGEVVFLELNPSGQWYWIEQRTGLPLLSAFVDLVTASDGLPCGS